MQNIFCPSKPSPSTKRDLYTSSLRRSRQSKLISSKRKAIFNSSRNPLQ